MTRFSTSQPDTDPLETSELAQRLRRMQWPTAPPDVKQRCLEKVLERVREGGAVPGGAPPAPEAAGD
jgi:hypothetical protein